MHKLRHLLSAGRAGDQSLRRAEFVLGKALVRQKRRREGLAVFRSIVLRGQKQANPYFRDTLLWLLSLEPRFGDPVAELMARYPDHVLLLEQISEYHREQTLVIVSGYLYRNGDRRGRARARRLSLFVSPGGWYPFTTKAEGSHFL